MTKKKSSKKTKKGTSDEKKNKSSKKKQEGPNQREKTKKIIITPKLRKIWWKLRHAYNMNYYAFSNALSMLSDEEANMLYDVVIVSLFKSSYAQILHEHPELKVLIKNDDDRLFMHDIYETLSWRLNRKEELPKDIKLKMNMKSGIGRAMGAELF